MQESSQSKKKVTVQSTKKEILDAYQEAVSEMENKDDIDPKVIKNFQIKTDGVRADLKRQTDSISETMFSEIEKVLDQIESFAESVNKLNNIKRSQEMAWKRSQEEYEYELNRKRQKEVDEWADKKQKLEFELAERDSKLKESEEELIELRNKDKMFEPRLAKSVKDEVDKAIQNLESEHKHKLDLMNSQRDAEQKLLESKLLSQTETLQDQKKEIERLNRQLDSANERLTKIATGAVQASKPSYNKAESD